MTEPNQQVLEQQIAELKRQLDTARSQSGQDSSAPYERKEVHEAIGDQIRQQAPEHQSSSQSSGGSVQSEVPSYQDPVIAEQVQSLVNIAFSQNIQAAIDQALKSDNPAIIDALHDVLVDQLHEELIKRQKLSPAV